MSIISPPSPSPTPARPWAVARGLSLRCDAEIGCSCHSARGSLYSLRSQHGQAELPEEHLGGRSNSRSLECGTRGSTTVQNYTYDHRKTSGRCGSTFGHRKALPRSWLVVMSVYAELAPGKASRSSHSIANYPGLPHIRQRSGVKTNTAKSKGSTGGGERQQELVMKKFAKSARHSDQRKD